MATVVGAVASAPAGAQAPVPEGVASALQSITTKPLYDHSIWGWSLADATTGEVLTESNADKMFVTGSILKVYATSTALRFLGPDFRFRTPVFRRGTVRAGTLDGDLVFKGSGDFSFGLREQADGTLGFNSSPEIDHNYADTGLAGPALVKDSHPLAGVDDLARQVRRSGIRRVTGDVVVDDRLFDVFDGWPDGKISPVWINENVIDIMTSPTTAGKPAKVDWRPRTAAIRVVSEVRTVRGQGTPLQVSGPENGVIRITGAISARSDEVVNIAQLPDPSSFARTAFIEALTRQGVRVDARATGANPAARLPASDRYPAGTRVAQRVSLPLSEYVKVILKVSYNRGADDMVCMVAVAVGSRSCIDGLSHELSTVQRLGVSPATTILFDGAGSSEFDRSSPRDFTAFLRAIQTQSWGPDLRAGLPILGVDGTFATNQAGTPAAGHVFVKSGTRAQGTPTDRQGILSAITQAGYIDAASGRKLVYSLFLRDLSFDSSFAQFFEADHDQGAIAAAFQQGY